MSDTPLTHLDTSGRARMVDVADKPSTDRRAVARAVVQVTPQTAAAVAAGDAPKGDVLGVARIAGIQAAKRTSELIPLCHPLALSYIGVDGHIDAQSGEIELVAVAGDRPRPDLAQAARLADARAAAALVWTDDNMLWIYDRVVKPGRPANA